MKKGKIYSILSTLFIGTIILFSAASCTEDKCKAIVCANAGVCTNGACKCPSGYEGVQCEVVNRARYKGSWSVSEDGTLSSFALYGITIGDGPNLTDIKITNFRNLFTQDVNAYVLADTMYIPQQTLDGKYSLQGIGYYKQDIYYGTRGSLTVRYEVTDLTTNHVDDFGFNSTINSNPSIWNK